MIRHTALQLEAVRPGSYDVAVPLELPQRDPCPFCENIAGRNPCAVIEDREATFVFVNPRQLQEGATLVIPKRHVPTVLDLTEDEAAAVMPCVVRIARAIHEAFDPEGLQLLQNNGVAASQTVPHFHMHIVPRYRGDSWERVEKSPVAARMQIAERIKRYL